MRQGRTILIVALVGIGAAGTWAWQHRAPSAQMKVASVSGSPEQPPPPPPAVPPPVSSEAASSAPATPQPPTPAAPVPPDNEQGETSVNTATPDVDTPEPAERKFARGARPASDEH